MRTKLFFNDSKRRWMTLSFSGKISELSRGITLKTGGDFYFLNCLHSFTPKSKLESHEKICENKDFLVF